MAAWKAVCFEAGVAADESATVAAWASLFPTRTEARQNQARVLHDIVGNPYRPVTLDQACLTPQVVALGQAAYEQRDLPAGTLDLARLAVLADALEGAGCTDSDLLGHLRGPGPHVRGCWAVDLLLGRE